MDGGGKIKNVFEQKCSHVQFDHNRLNRMRHVQEGFVVKNPDHIEFFGGTLTGVQTVRFTDRDRDQFFDTVVEADESDLEHLLYRLKDEEGKFIIDQGHARGSDVFNIACIYLIHKFHTSTQLDEGQREQAKESVGSFLIYKFLTSLLFWYFKYPADPEVAKATYDKLTYKYALKANGSWKATLTALSKSMVGPTSVHIKAIETMDEDAGVERMINDIQNRVKDMLKNIYSVFMEVHAAGARVTNSSTFTEIEGEIELKDTIQAAAAYSRYIKSIIHDKNTFVKNELVAVVTKTMHTMPPRLLILSLQWTSDNYLGSQSTIIDEAVDVVMEHAIQYFSENRDISKADIGKMIERLRGSYMSSRSTDVLLLKAREKVEKIVEISTGSKNANAVASVRTAWMLYLVSRAYTRNYYASH